MKKFLLKSTLFTLIFCAGISITYFLIKARTSTNPNLWDDGTSLYTNSNETLTAAKRNALVDKSMSCPTGFTAITKNGSMLGCLQNTNGSGKTCLDAIQDCRNNYGGRLPSYSELYIGFKNNLITIWTAGIREWTDSGWYYYKTSDFQSCWIISNSSPYNPSYKIYTDTSIYYRCFIPR